MIAIMATVSAYHRENICSIPFLVGGFKNPHCMQLAREWGKKEGVNLVLGAIGGLAH